MIITFFSKLLWVFIFGQFSRKALAYGDTDANGYNAAAGVQNNYTHVATSDQGYVTAGSYQASPALAGSNEGLAVAASVKVAVAGDVQTVHNVQTIHDVSTVHEIQTIHDVQTVHDTVYMTKVEIAKETTTQVSMATTTVILTEEKPVTKVQVMTMTPSSPASEAQAPTVTVSGACAVLTSPEAASAQTSASAAYIPPPAGTSAPVVNVAQPAAQSAPVQYNGGGSANRCDCQCLCPTSAFVVAGMAGTMGAMDVPPPSTLQTATMASSNASAITPSIMMKSESIASTQATTKSTSTEASSSSVTSSTMTTSTLVPRPSSSISSPNDTSEASTDDSKPKQLNVSPTMLLDISSMSLASAITIPVVVPRAARPTSF